MMRFEILNSDDLLTKTIDFEDDSASHRTNKGVGKHPLLDTSGSQHSTESSAKRIRSSPQRISCKARGLSNRHNADNAYLEIPAGAPHGLPLRCSDPECASSGRRFRYCQVCGVPVAKRNFLQRHGHGMVNTAMQLRNDVDNHCQPSTGSWTTPLASDVILIGEMRRGVRFENTGDHLDASFAGASYQEYPLDFREKKWLTLLHECPNVTNPTCMTNWMDKVLSFSEHEMNTSRDAQIQTFPSTISCIDVVHMPLASPIFQSVYDSGISVAAMERPKLGLYTQSSTATLGTIFGQTTQESAKVASEIAEFDDFMDGVDTTSVFV